MDVGLAITIANYHDFERYEAVRAGGTDFKPKISDAEIYANELRLGRLAEPLGFNSIFLAEHHFTPYVLVPNPLSLLPYFAAVTEEINLGTWVIVTPWHDAIRVAEGIATVDLCLQGRKFYPCMGRGVSRLEYDGMGIPFEGSRERFQECLDILRLALSGEAFSYEGKHFKIPRVELRPKPWSDPKELLDRLHMAWGSPESMPLTAKAGLKALINPQRGWNAYANELGEFHRIRTGCGYEAARPIIATWVLCAPTEAEAEEKARKYFRHVADSVLRHYEIARPENFEGVKGYEGYLERARDLAKQPAEELTEKYGELFYNANAWGTPEMVYEKLSRINDMVSPEQMICAMSFGGMPFDEAEASMRLFSEEVLPAVKKLPHKPIIGSVPTKLDPNDPQLAAAMYKFGDARK